MSEEQPKHRRSLPPVWAILLAAGVVLLALGGVLAGRLDGGLLARPVLILLGAGCVSLATGVFLVVRTKALLARAGLSLILAAFALGLVLAAGAVFYGTVTIRELLTENRRLKEAIANLTREDQIGYAKVLSQERRDGRLYTTLKFVETARDDKTKIVLEREYTVEGDIIHFDALIVKFQDRLVMDGKERALYLWRRVYGEKMTPEQGFPIETVGEAPGRYEEIFRVVPAKHKELFWHEIWTLADDSERLSDIGVQAIYGNAIYTRLRPGLIYVFKIGATGQVYPETTPDL